VDVCTHEKWVLGDPLRLLFGRDVETSKGFKKGITLDLAPRRSLA